VDLWLSDVPWDALYFSKVDATFWVSKISGFDFIWRSFILLKGLTFWDALHEELTDECCAPRLLPRSFRKSSRLLFNDSFISSPRRIDDSASYFEGVVVLPLKGLAVGILT
jgi:hypothetical protein